MSTTSSIGGFVIYDCDIGIDDAWGLLMLLKGEQLFRKLSQNVKIDVDRERLPDVYKILAITCVQGNTDVDNCAKNALRVLDSVDRLDVSFNFILSKYKILIFYNYFHRYLFIRVVINLCCLVLGNVQVIFMALMVLVIFPIYQKLPQNSLTLNMLLMLCIHWFAQ